MEEHPNAKRQLGGRVLASPCISIGLPVFNGELRIRRALDSILMQDFSDFEIVVSDNASDDQTGAVCQSYARKDARIRYYRNEKNIGINPNHDRTFELSKGKYFAWFADDVEYLPGMLSRCVQIIEQAPPSVVMVYPGCEMIRDGQGFGDQKEPSLASSSQRPHQRLESVIRNAGMVNQFFGLTRSQALRHTRLNGRYPSSDYVLLGELAMLGEIREIPEILIRRRIDSDRGTAAVHNNARAWKAWSGAGDRSLMDAWMPNRERLAVEYLRAAWRSPIGVLDKSLCLACILPVYYSRTSRVVRAALRLVRPWKWQGSLRPDKRPSAT